MLKHVKFVVFFYFKLFAVSDNVACQSACCLPPKHWKLDLKRSIGNLKWF